MKAKIQQDPNNPILSCCFHSDPDLNAITMIRMGVKIDTKTVDLCIQHYLSFLHPGVDGRSMEAIRKSKVPCFCQGLGPDDDATREYVDSKLALLRKSCLSCDRKKYGDAFLRSGLKEKYGLSGKFTVTRKTKKIVESSEISLHRRKEKGECTCGGNCGCHK